MSLLEKVRGHVRHARRIVYATTVGALNGAARASIGPENLGEYDDLILSILERSIPKTVEYGRRVREQQSREHCCGDCGSYGLSYMLVDDVWAQVGEAHDVFCLRCAEKRLGRPISVSDLSDAPLNDPARYFLLDEDACERYRRLERRLVHMREKGLADHHVAEVIQRQLETAWGELTEDQRQTLRGESPESPDLGQHDPRSGWVFSRSISAAPDASKR